MGIATFSQTPSVKNEPMAALVQLSLHILCLDNASASGKLAGTTMHMGQLHSLQLQSHTVQDMESVTLPDSLLGRSHCCPQQSTTISINMPVDMCPFVQASSPCLKQRKWSLEHG